MTYLPPVIYLCTRLTLAVSLAAAAAVAALFFGAAHLIGRPEPDRPRETPPPPPEPRSNADDTGTFDAIREWGP